MTEDIEEKKSMLKSIRDKNLEGFLSSDEGNKKDE